MDSFASYEDAPLKSNGAAESRIEKYRIKSIQLDPSHTAIYTEARMPAEFSTAYFGERTFTDFVTTPIVELSDYLQSGEGHLLILLAPPKYGKTHLLTMISESVKLGFPERKILFGDAEELLPKVQKMPPADVLLLDNCSNTKADRKIMHECASAVIKRGGICVYAFSDEGLDSLDALETLLYDIQCVESTSFTYLLKADETINRYYAFDYALVNGCRIGIGALSLIASKAGSLEEIRQMISEYCSGQQ